jgi:hypothetical protein
MSSAKTIPLIEPDDSTTIWRYSDLARFAALIFRSELWFAKAKHLEKNDPWEAFGKAVGLPEPTREDIRDVGDLAFGLYAKMSHLASRDILNGPELVYINSWFLFTESMLMWDRYGDGGRGVAIKSTVGRFKMAIQRGLRPEQYRFGAVRYADEEAIRNTVHDFTGGNVPASGKLWDLVLGLAFSKRSAYHGENEWRAAIYQESLRPDITGLEVGVSLDELIDEVWLGPDSGEVEKKAVTEILKRSSAADKPIMRSKVKERP